MFIRNDKRMWWQVAGYLLTNAAILATGYNGFTYNKFWFITAFYVIIFGETILALVYGISVLWCLPEDQYKVAVGIAVRGSYRWNWLEYFFEATLILGLLWFLHPLIAAFYLSGCIIMARVRWEVWFVGRPLQTLEYALKED